MLELVDDPETGQCFARRDLPDGRRAWVIPMLFGNARLVVGPPGSGYVERAWCYSSPTIAVRALEAWDGVDAPPAWRKDVMGGVWRDQLEVLHELDDALERNGAPA